MCNESQDLWDHFLAFTKFLRMPLGSVSDPLNRKMMPSLARPWWLRNEDKCVINGCHFTDPENCIEGPRFYVVVTITIFKLKFRFWAIRSNLYSIFSSAEIKLWFSPSIFPNMIAYRCHSYSNNNNKQQQMTRVSLNGNQVMVCRWPPPPHHHDQPYLPALLPPIWRDVVRGSVAHWNEKTIHHFCVGVSNNHQFLQMVLSCPTLVAKGPPFFPSIMRRRRTKTRCLYLS